jgi:hypothetical protein
VAEYLTGGLFEASCWGLACNLWRAVAGILRCPGTVEPGSDGGGDGARPVLAGQPDLGGCAGERLDGGAGVEVAVGDQFTGAQAGPEQQPAPFAAAGGAQAPEDALQPDLGVRAVRGRLYGFRP